MSVGGIFAAVWQMVQPKPQEPTPAEVKRAIAIHRAGKTHADCRHMGKPSCMALSTVEPEGYACPYQNHVNDIVREREILSGKHGVDALIELLHSKYGMNIEREQVHIHANGVEIKVIHEGEEIEIGVKS